MRLSLFINTFNLWGVNKSKNIRLIKSFGKNIRRIRLSNGISQERLADEAKIELSQIGRIERGEINTTISTAHALAVALNVRLTELFEFKIE